MAKQSLAAQTPGALTSELKLPAAFTAPSAKIEARKFPPYITFCHPKRADEWAKLSKKFGQLNEGDMYFVHNDDLRKLDSFKACWLCHTQYWASTNPAGQVQATAMKELPKPFKEHVEAVLLLFLEDRILPCNVQFRTTKCGAARTMSDALEECVTPGWADNSPAHKESLICTQPFMRFFGIFQLGAQRTGKETGLLYRPLTAEVKPTGVAEWRALDEFTKAPDTQELMDKAAERYQSRIAEVKQKLK